MLHWRFVLWTWALLVIADAGAQQPDKGGVVSAGPCRLVKPSSLVAEEKRERRRSVWDGPCQSGFANGRGVLRVYSRDGSLQFISSQNRRDGKVVEVWESYTRIENRTDVVKRTNMRSKPDGEVPISAVPSWAQEIAISASNEGRGNSPSQARMQQGGPSATVKMGGTQAVEISNSNRGTPGRLLVSFIIFVDHDGQYDAGSHVAFSEAEFQQWITARAAHIRERAARQGGSRTSLTPGEITIFGQCRVNEGDWVGILAVHQRGYKSIQGRQELRSFAAGGACENVRGPDDAYNRSLAACDKEGRVCSGMPTNNTSGLFAAWRVVKPGNVAWNVDDFLIPHDQHERSGRKLTCHSGYGVTKPRPDTDECRRLFQGYPWY